MFSPTLDRYETTSVCRGDTSRAADAVVEYVNFKVDEEMFEALRQVRVTNVALHGRNAAVHRYTRTHTNVIDKTTYETFIVLSKADL